VAQFSRERDAADKRLAAVQKIGNGETAVEQRPTAAAVNRPLALLRPLLRLAHVEWEAIDNVPRIRLEKEPQGRLVIRPAVQDDLEVLWDFLAMAAYESDAEAAKAVPSIAKYLVGWGRPGDFGFIAEQNGKIIGAAWARRFSADELTSPYGDEETPKVSIGVNPNARGQDIGETLMRALIGEAARCGLGLCLSVRSENPARRLYERLGFRDIPGSAATNRAGGLSIGMALRR
jgi:ribosomal protein S18 acetylase RimI-like enzyme